MEVMVDFTNQLQMEACISQEDRVIASRLFKLRTNMGIKRRDLAVMAGLAESDIYSFESGQQEVPASDLFLLAVALGVSINYFYEDETLYSFCSNANLAEELVS